MYRDKAGRGTRSRSHAEPAIALPAAGHSPIGYVELAS